MTQECKSFLPEEFRFRDEKLRAKMEKQDIDMLLLSTPENIYYSTSYRSWYASGLFRPIYVLTPREGDPAIILRILEKATVQYTSWTGYIYCWGTANKSLGPLKGVEPVSITDRTIKETQPDIRAIGLKVGDGIQYFWSMEPLKKIIDSQPGICFINGFLAIQRTRIVKTPWEIE